MIEYVDVLLYYVDYSGNLISDLGRTYFKDVDCY